MLRGQEAPWDASGAGGTGQGRIDAWSPSSASALTTVLFALRRALSSRSYCATWLWSGPRLRAAFQRVQESGTRGRSFILKAWVASPPPPPLPPPSWPLSRSKTPPPKVCARPLAALRAPGGGGDDLVSGSAPRARQSGDARRKRGAVASTLYVRSCSWERVLTSTAPSRRLVSRTTSLPAAPLVRERSLRVRLQFPEGAVRVESKLSPYSSISLPGSCP